MATQHSYPGLLWISTDRGRAREGFFLRLVTFANRKGRGSAKAADKVHDKVSAEIRVAGTEKNLDFLMATDTPEWFRLGSDALRAGAAVPPSGRTPKSLKAFIGFHFIGFIRFY